MGGVTSLAGLRIFPYGILNTPNLQGQTSLCSKP